MTESYHLSGVQSTRAPLRPANRLKTSLTPVSTHIMPSERLGVLPLTTSGFKTQGFDYLTSLSFLEDEYYSAGRLATAYQHDGEVWEEYESVAAYSGNLGYFSVVNLRWQSIFMKNTFRQNFIKILSMPTGRTRKITTLRIGRGLAPPHTRYLQNL